MPCYKPLKGWRDFGTGGIQFREKNHEAMEVACGQCLGCRLDRSRVWAVRIIHECSLHEYNGGNCFITLTYDDEHVPTDWSLKKSDFQKFMKRLRKSTNAKIRYFHVGEYGAICQHGLATTKEKAEELGIPRCRMCRLGRPHYHAILFNYMFRDLQYVQTRKGVDYYTSPSLEKLWGQGFVNVGEVTFQSAAYVSRYCLKKVTGKKASDHYMNFDEEGVVTFLLPEYCSMSTGRRCAVCKKLECKNSTRGIGYQWFKEYKDDCYPADDVPVPGVGVLKKLPRYYDQLCGEVDAELLEEVKRLRKVFREAHADDYTPERLMAKYKVKQAQIGSLRRTM